MTSKKEYLEGLIGRKLGMTQVFNDAGDAIPVTAIEVGPCFVVQVKNKEKDGYNAVQLGFEPKKPQRVRKPLMGHFAKAGKGAFYHIKEVRCDVEKLGWASPGKEIKLADVFSEVKFVDVSGVSIGHGFSGVMKRYGMKGQPATRGTHEDRRNIGSIGCRKYPGRVFKNKKMSGHYGDENVTIQNLKVVQIRPEENVILVRGAVPGARGSIVVVRKAVKKLEQAKKAA